MSAADDSTESVLGDAAAGSSEDDRRRRTIGAVIAAIIIILFVWWFLTRLAPVPDLVGLAQETAIDRAEDAGFQVGSVRSVNVEGADAGTVTSQLPGAGSWRLRGSDITILVALGAGDGDDSGRASGDDGAHGDSPSTVEPGDEDDDGVSAPPVTAQPRLMIDVQGLTEASARDRLRRAGLAHRVVYKNASASYIGTVFYQSPAPDTIYSAGTVVEIWISIGPKNPVPGN